MRAPANKKAAVVPIDEARRRLRAPAPPIAPVEHSRARWMAVIPGLAAAAIVIGVVVASTLIHDARAQYLVAGIAALGVLVISMTPLGLLLRRKPRDRSEGGGDDRRVIPLPGATTRPPSRPSRPCA